MDNCKPITNCLACDSTHLVLTLDLGQQPLANNFRDSISTDAEQLYPLAINRCENCNHLQLTHAVDPALIYTHYLYVSGTSGTYLEYMDWYAKFVREQFRHWPSRVLDIGCNDGSQLNVFKKLGFTTYGVDPAENLYPVSSANHNVKLGFWNEESVSGFGTDFDVITCQNAFAHNPDPVAFLKLAREYLRIDGKIFIQTSQADMVPNGEFDTIYHEHLSFYTIKSMDALCRRAGLNLIDAIKHPIHGNSFIFVISATKSRPYHIENLINFEKSQGLHDLETYKDYQVESMSKANALKDFIVNFRATHPDTPIIGFGAPAKGNTLLNYIKVTPDFIIDENPLKQGMYTPGVGVVIYGMDYLDQYKDKETLCFLPLAWNFFSEIKSKIEKVRPNSKDIFVKYFPQLTTPGLN